MNFYLYREEIGQGCDYTIGCGESLSLLQATTKEAAIIEAHKALDNTFKYGELEAGAWKAGENVVSRALILETVATVTAYAMECAKEYNQLKEKEAKEEKRKLIKKLQKELEE